MGQQVGLRGERRPVEPEVDLRRTIAPLAERRSQLGAGDLREERGGEREAHPVVEGGGAQVDGALAGQLHRLSHETNDRRREAGAGLRELRPTLVEVGARELGQLQDGG
jgi:hypothetical protein